jgi:hypothetical protein
MWELMNSRGYETTYMAIIDAQGALLTEIEEIPNTRLNLNDPLRFNRVTGNVHWAVNASNGLNIYSLNPDKPINLLQ